MSGTDLGRVVPRPGIGACIVCMEAVVEKDLRLRKNMIMNTLHINPRSLLPDIVIACCSVAQLCLTLCDPMDYRLPCRSPTRGAHQRVELAQTHVHQVGDAIQPSLPLLSPSPPAFNLSQHQGLFQCVSSSHQVAKVLEFQLQHQFFQ